MENDCLKLRESFTKVLEGVTVVKDKRHSESLCFFVENGCKERRLGPEKVLVITLGRGPWNVKLGTAENNPTSSW